MRVLARLLALGCAALIGWAWPGAVAPAGAETIFLKNGTQIKGKITKQDEENFEVLTAQGSLKIAKAKVAVEDLPNPVIAAGLGLAFPGAGQAYIGRWDKAAFYIFLTSVAFGTSFVVGSLGKSGSLTAAKSEDLVLPVAIGSVTAVIPLGLGSYDAYLEALRKNAEPKFKIDYGEGL